MAGPSSERSADERPVILAVDPDREAISRITEQLHRRYARDYRVVCGSSTEEALAELERLRDARARVAVVLAGRGEAGLRGEELLERVNDLHPHAKRGLLIEFGAWGVDVPIAWKDGGSTVATGNSFAAPHIAGLVALILSKHPGLTPFELKAILASVADNPGRRHPWRRRR